MKLLHDLVATRKLLTEQERKAIHSLHISHYRIRFNTSLNKFEWQIYDTNWKTLAPEAIKVWAKSVHATPTLEELEYAGFTII